MPAARVPIVDDESDADPPLSVTAAYVVTRTFDELYKLNVTVPVGVPDDPETVALTLAVEHEGELGVKLRVGVLVAIENGSAELDAIGEYVPLPL